MKLAIRLFDKGEEMPFALRDHSREELYEELQKITQKIVQFECLSPGHCMRQLVIELMNADRPELYRLRMPDYINNKHAIGNVLGEARKLVSKGAQLGVIKST